MTVVSLPRYFVTYYINESWPEPAKLPSFKEVTDMYVKVEVNFSNLIPLSAMKTKATELSESGNLTVKKSAGRALTKLKVVGVP